MSPSKEASKCKHANALCANELRKDGGGCSRVNKNVP